jgi:DNA mismatch repair protein MutS
MPSAPPVPSISLLWPPGAGVHAPNTPRLSARAAADLDLETTVRALSASPGDQRMVTAALSTLCADPDVIAYRQAVLEDLLNAPELLARLEALLPAISAVERFRYASRPGQTPLHEVVWRVGQLESYVECVRGLTAAFEGQAARVNSDALRRLCDEAARAAQDPLFAQLERDLPAMTKAVRSVASITIGVNLDDQLRPVGATLIDIHDRPFRGETPSLFGALFRGQQDGLSSIGPLHSVPRERTPNRPSDIDFTNPMLYPLFRDVAQVLKHASRPVARVLQKYVGVGVAFFVDLRAELAFYVGAVRLIERLRAAGLPVCRPEIAPVEARTCEIEDAYNLNLALRALADGSASRIVLNDIRFNGDGRIFILTGPNQGGKTTYAQAIGLAQVLAQAGLYVPGSRARISPVDAIHTHFPVEEAPARRTPAW